MREHEYLPREKKGERERISFTLFPLSPHLFGFLISRKGCRKGITRYVNRREAPRNTKGSRWTG